MKKFMPTRNEATEIIADIDALVIKPISVILHGKKHKIEPIDLQHFLSWSNAVASLWDIKTKEATDEEIIYAYMKIIGSVCPTITVEDIRKCEKAQLAALYGVIFDHCTGRAHTEDYKKKVLSQEKTYQSLS